MVEEGSDSRLFKIASNQEVMEPVIEDDGRRAQEEAKIDNLTVFGRKTNSK